MLLPLLVAIAMPMAAFAQDCPGDLNGDGQVTVDEILLVVNTALTGCSAAATPTPSVPSGPTATPTRSGTATRTPTRTRTATPLPRFLDNGDGTITDTDSNLIWEKKSDDGSIHDKDLLFSWSVSGSPQPTGTVFSQLIASLNAQRFAGERDWRLPTRDELATLVDRGASTPGHPLVPPQFDDDCSPGCSVTHCSCTEALNYWTATTADNDFNRAWYVLFNTGDSATAFKTLQFYARAVRGGD